MFITERGKKHCLGVGYACLPGWEGDRPQFGAAGFGILRLEVTHPTQPTMPKSQMFGRTKSEKTPEAVGLGQPFLGVFRIVHYIDCRTSSI